MLPLLVVPVGLLVTLVNINMLLKLMQRILGAVCKSIQSRGVHMVRGNMAIRHHVIRRQCIVCRETVEWIGKHSENLPYEPVLEN